MSDVQIYASQPVVVRMVRLDCPSCKHPRRMIATEYEWYSGTIMCLRCGDKWGEDGRCERPFERGWRRKRIRAAWKEYVRHRRAA